MIPRTVHQVWLGGGKLSPVLGGLVDGVRHHCDRAGWLHVLWTERNLLSCFGESWLSFSARCCHLSQRSNVARYLLLAELGGLYLDTDTEVFSLPRDLEGAWIAGTQDSNPGAVNPAVMAAERSHPYVRRLVAALSVADLGVHGSAGPALASAHLDADVSVWPSVAWHGKRGEAGAFGHHYCWGRRLRSFSRFPVDL